MKSPSLLSPEVIEKTRALMGSVEERLERVIAGHTCDDPGQILVDINTITNVLRLDDGKAPLEPKTPCVPGARQPGRARCKLMSPADTQAWAKRMAHLMGIFHRNWHAPADEEDYDCEVFPSLWTPHTPSA
jgi:hypothetical protein